MDPSAGKEESASGLGEATVAVVEVVVEPKDSPRRRAAAESKEGERERDKSSLRVALSGRSCQVRSSRNGRGSRGG